MCKTTFIRLKLKIEVTKKEKKKNISKKTLSDISQVQFY